MNATLITSLCFPVLASLGFAQGVSPDLPSTPFNYSAPNLPTHFLVDPPGPPTSVVSQDNEPANNIVTDAGATLGRVLFYDKMLSFNSRVACASCHHQANGFSDPQVLSHGFAGGTTRRHSMSLANARYFLDGSFFWDQRASTLEDQVLMPIQDGVEMGLTLNQMVERIDGRSFYDDLYTQAFGDATVTSERTARALAQFVRSLESYQSRYDVGRAQVGNPGANFPNFTAQENAGKNLFTLPPPQGLGCAGCHTTDAQVNAPIGPMNNGLDAVSTTDLGVFETTGLPQHLGAFKVPSLRNIAVTAPYMHDGRFATLQAVLNFYSNGIQNHPNLHPLLRTPGGQPIQFNLNQGQKDALIAFFGTLTDPVFLNDEKFANPFPEGLGQTYCDPAQPNSQAMAASMQATGTRVAAANDVLLSAVGLPPNQFAMFIAGSSQDLVLFPGGSQGVLCVGGSGGGLGRIATSLQSTGSLGMASHQLDLAHIPIAVAPFEVAMQAGMTWNFQTWYRDNGGNNNFSNAVSLTFQ
ncbi:MAG: cytochrome-c peroxidase [Planctomycetes bacterium]|nr:cytochrome-c peroxidase [Planctomycetota bacterium]MCB9909105.1 cytochrome-c peroxidase [Planctomycetota bacterium]MCB9911645.1 cytochrome-c peroxidase [Planctomycetota bacterium]HPF14738.1 cytochrome c peroxidase [Planctomycetota bacterium]